MPSAVATSPGVGGPQATPATAAAARVPFDQASHRGLEAGPVFTPTITANQQTLGNGPTPLPAQGYLRKVTVDVATSTAAVGAVTTAADFPFNIFSILRLHDTNGAPIFELTGFNTYLANLLGGYQGMDDPASMPDFSSNGLTPSFQVDVPIEIDPDGFGVLANQSASAAYKLTLQVDSQTNIYTSAPATSQATLTIRTFCQFWTLPAAADMLGRPMQQYPNYHGVAQYWSQSMNNSVAAGTNTTRVTRTGNLYRALCFVGRVAGVRSAAAFPDPYQLKYDTRDLMIGSQRQLRRDFFALLTAPTTTYLTGVFPFIWSYGRLRSVGSPGYSSWLPTVAATRLEIVGSSAGSGTLDIVSNDVSVAETSPAARAVETSATSGYHPPVAPTVLAAQ